MLVDRGAAEEQPNANDEKGEESELKQIKRKILLAAGMPETEGNLTNLPGYLNVAKNQG